MIIRAGLLRPVFFHYWGWIISSDCPLIIWLSNLSFLVFGFFGTGQSANYSTWNIGSCLKAVVSFGIYRNCEFWSCAPLIIWLANYISNVLKLLRLSKQSVIVLQLLESTNDKIVVLGLQGLANYQIIVLKLLGLVSLRRADQRRGESVRAVDTIH